MHTNNFLTNKWMQEPRKNFCRLQVQHCDPNNYRRLGHLAKECPDTGPICLYCKIVGHEVEDYPRMIAKVERMNMRQENYEGSQETKSTLETHKEK
jgi:hypothetical protein